MKNIRNLTALLSGIVLASAVIIPIGTQFKFDPNKEISVSIPEDCKVKDEKYQLGLNSDKPVIDYTVKPLENNLPVFYDAPWLD